MTPRNRAQNPAEHVTPPADTPQPPAPVEQPALDWYTLPAPVAMPDRKPFQGITVKVVETVPGPIRTRAEASLAVNAAKVKAKTTSSASRPRVDYHWDIQPVVTTEMGTRFVALITKYSKYRPSEGTIPFAHEDSPAGQVTARCGDVGYYVTRETGEVDACEPTTEGSYLGVRYSVRPFEKRNNTSRLPGTS